MELRTGLLRLPCVARGRLNLALDHPSCPLSFNATTIRVTPNTIAYAPSHQVSTKAPVSGATTSSTVSLIEFARGRGLGAAITQTWRIGAAVAYFASTPFASSRAIQASS